MPSDEGRQFSKKSLFDAVHGIATAWQWDVLFGSKTSKEVAEVGESAEIRTSAV